MYRLLLCIYLCVGVFLPFMLQAQAVPAGVSASIVSEPRYPKPNEPVTLSMEAYGVIFTDADLSWYINGAKTPVSAGKRSMQITAPAFGTTTHVSLLVQQPSGVPIVIQHTIVPAVMDIILESSVVSSPFFNIKMSPAANTRVHAGGILHRSGFPGAQYSYRWEFSGNTEQTLYGQHVSFEMPEYDTTLIVHVLDNQGVEVYTSGTTITAATPRLHIYPYTQGVVAYRPVENLGVYVPKSDTETFFTEIFNRPGNAEIVWSVNDTPVQPVSGSPEILTLGSIRETSSTLGVSLSYGLFGVSRSSTSFTITP